MAGGACVDDPGADSTMQAIDVCVQSSDGSLCDDRQPCTIDDACINRKCVGTPVADGRSCTDGNVCTGPDQCRAGVCVGPALIDGTACTDDDPCTDLDTCQVGICRPGGPFVCQDNDPCTLDTCVTGTGCVFSPRECPLVVDAAADVSRDVAIDLPRDLAPDTVLVDVGFTDALAIDTAGVDLPIESATSDAPGPTVDLGSDVASVPDAGVDAVADAVAGADAAPDASDGSAARDGAPDLMETPPDLRARGGGCQCSATAPATLPGAPLLAAGLFMLCLASRRRRQ